MSKPRHDVLEAFGGLDPRAGATTADQSLDPGADRSAGPIGPVSGLRAYRTPRLTRLAQVDELLDALGPAQAGYGGAGLVP